MFSDWPAIEPEQDNQILQDAEKALVEFLRSLYIKGVGHPLRPDTGDQTPICRN